MSYRQKIPTWSAPVAGLGRGHGGGGHGGGHGGAMRGGGGAAMMKGARGGGHHGGHGGRARLRRGRNGWGYPLVWGWGPGYYGYGYYYDTSPGCEDRCDYAATEGEYSRCMDACASQSWF